MSARSQLVGRRFGKWEVLEASGVNKNNHCLWLCRCDCGTVKVVVGNNLKTGISTNCGGCSRGVHRKCRRNGRTREYRSWQNMIQRCTNPNTPNFRDYGGRGIKVCKRWRKFVNFFADMGERPANRTLDRIDNDGNYEPGNCKWSTLLEQRANQRAPRKRK